MGRAGGGTFRGKMCVAGTLTEVNISVANGTCPGRILLRARDKSVVEDGKSMGDRTERERGGRKLSRLG